jgi:hypothetical protein
VTDDVLPLLSPLRQAAIIRIYLLEAVFDDVGDYVGQRYRSPAEIRAAVAAEVASWRADPGLFPQSCGIQSWTSTRDRARSGWRAQVFEKLAAENGSQCWACQKHPACYIDHDHFTHEVRGLLCAHCNPDIDGCLHVSELECFAARYLMTFSGYPGLRYRLPNLVTRRDRRRCLVLGFNMFDRRCWPSPNPVEWTWTPPPLGALDNINHCRLGEFRSEWASGRQHIVRTQGIRAAGSA